MNILADELRRKFEPVEAFDFYREIFGDGELDEAEAFTKGKYTAIAVEVTKKKIPDPKRPGKEKVVCYRHSVTDDFDVIDELQHSPHFCIIAPISYAGKSRHSKNARLMYALGVELDNLKVSKAGNQTGLNNLIARWSERSHFIPKPTFIVASGNGVHLYYQFERPLVLFPNTIESLKEYKEQLTKMIWHKDVTVSCTDETIQQESIFQGFRMVGTLTKKGDRVEAFRVGDKVSIEYMNSFMYSSFKGSKDIQGTYKSDLLLKDAKEKYPEWYEKVIVNGDHSVKEWAVNRAVYDWWKTRIYAEAVDGHRYYCLKMLAIYAIKCGNYDEKKNPNPVTQEEFEADAWELLDEFNDRTIRPDNPFTENDVMSAIQAYEDRGLITYPVKSIGYKSGITIKPSVKRREKGKRLKQPDHIQSMNMMRDIRYKDGSWRNLDGRPTKQDIVMQWREEHPDGKKADCIRDTGLSKPTVLKWWNDTPSEENLKTLLKTMQTEEERKLAQIEKERARLEAEIKAAEERIAQMKKELEEK